MLKHQQSVFFLFTLCLSLLLSGCVVLPKQTIAPDTRLSGCLPFPNCVSSTSSSFIHQYEPMTLAMPVTVAWPTVREAVLSLPNTKITHEIDFYLYAKSYSALFRFVDFVELLYLPETEQLQVRSSSMLGLSDLGVNRQRVNQLRDALLEQKVILP